ncbi:MAG: 3-oxoacyl-ACP reductase [Alphaproteobacteria bacterium]|nr:MAG: 3-oxoacyl-ACP reductase [Alphaproteobacteria bacterium]
MAIRFDGQVVIVTGGANGLGREHCLQLARLGAKVVVNDYGGNVEGTGTSGLPAQKVVDEIIAAGGEAIANGADITNMEQVLSMVENTMKAWGRVDILINNAGILRDKSFAKMALEDFEKVVNVHLYGALNCTKAVWDIMRAQTYGRILMTSSASGLFGNFGQSNYGAAKAGVVGLMNVLSIEGAKYNIQVNTLAPTAATRMLDGLLADDVANLMGPELVAPGALYLVSESAPSKTILGAGAGCFSVIRIYETAGHFVKGAALGVDDVADNWELISNIEGQTEMESAFKQTDKFVTLAAKKLGVQLNNGT